MARYNIKNGRDLAKRVAQEVAGRSDQTATARKVEIEIIKAIKNFSGTERAQSLQYLLNRMQREGDPFRNLTNLGPVHEAIIGIYLGVYKTEEDIESYDVFDSIPFWVEGDLVFKQKDNVRVDMQVKGPTGYIHIMSDAKIILKSDGSLDRDASLPEIIRAYLKKSPVGIRFGLPIYRLHNTKGFFDLGSLTFRRMSQLYPTWFSPNLDTKYRSVPKSNFKAETERLFKQFQLDTAGFKELQILTRTNLSKEQNELKKIITKRLLKQRVAEWKKYGTVSINYDPVKMALNVNPLIDTGIARYEDHTPFYKIIKTLYGTSDLGQYLYGNSNTAPNKTPQSYYSGNYHSLNY